MTKDPIKKAANGTYYFRAKKHRYLPSVHRGNLSPVVQNEADRHSPL